MTTEHLATFLGALRANGVTEYEGPGTDGEIIKVKLSPAPAPAVERPARKATPSVAPGIAELRAAAGLDASAIAELQETLSG